jgi:hypothetical protein
MIRRPSIDSGADMLILILGRHLLWTGPDGTWWYDDAVTHSVDIRGETRAQVLRAQFTFDLTTWLDWDEPGEEERAQSGTNGGIRLKPKLKLMRSSFHRRHPRRFTMTGRAA